MQPPPTPPPAVGPGAPGWEMPPPTQYQPPRKSRPPVGLIALAVILVGGALYLFSSGLLSGGGKVEGGGRPYSYEYPGSVEQRDPSEVPARARDASMQNVTVVGSDDVMVVVGSYPGFPANGTVDSPAIRQALNAKLTEIAKLVGTSIPALQSTTVAGRPALTAEFIGSPSRQLAGERVYLFAANGNAYMIDCNGRPGTTEFRGVCDKIVKTFQIGAPSNAAAV